MVVLSESQSLQVFFIVCTCTDVGDSFINSGGLGSYEPV